MNYRQAIQTLEPGGVVYLFEVIHPEAGTLLFHGHEGSAVIHWQGREFIQWPIEAQGFAKTGEQPPQPTLTVGNVDGSITALCQDHTDMLGAKVIRRQVLKRHLDAANFSGGNPEADSTQGSEEEVWYIERKAGEDKRQVAFELSGIDFNGAMLPGRQIIASRCGWLVRGGYRGPYCGYTGGPVADRDDVPTADPARDRCSGTVAGCKLRFGENEPLPYGGFPAAALLR